MARNFVPGSSQFIEFPSISLGTVYTVACRYKTPVANGNQNLFGQRSTVTANISLFDLEQQGTNMRFFVFGDASEFANMLTPIGTVNLWHTLVGRRNGNDFNLFLDGVDSASTTVTMGAITANSLNIGAVVQASTTRVSFWDGDIAECAVWNVALTDAEIAAYNKGVSPFLIRPINLFRYYPLYGTTQEADLSGSGDVGTNNGSTASGFHSPSGRINLRKTIIGSTVSVFLNGTVRELGIPVGRVVVVYSKATGQLLAVTDSDSSSGAFSIPDLPDEDFYVVALDNDAGIDFNADIIFATGVLQ